MPSSPSHLTCCARNRFTPSIALWTYFVVPVRQNALQHRLSSNLSTAKEADLSSTPGIKDTLVGDAGSGSTTAAVEAQPPSLRVTKVGTSKGSWLPRLPPDEYAKQIASKGTRGSIPVDLHRSNIMRVQNLQTAKTAFHSGQDYDACVIAPIKKAPRYIENRLPWVVPLEQHHASGLDRLKDEIGMFYQYARPTEIESRARKQVVQEVRSLVRPDLPKGSVLEIFGSERSGLALATSDIDLRLAQQEDLAHLEASIRPLSFRARRATGELLRPLYDRLNNSEAFMLVTRQHARFPLVNMTHRRTGVEMQIVTSPNTIMQQEIMADYIKQFPFLPQVYAVAKATLDIRGLSDVFHGGIGSYTLFMMIVASLKLERTPNVNKYPLLKQALGRNDAAGALLRFLKFSGSLDANRFGLSIDPIWRFRKGQVSVSSDRTIGDKSTNKPQGEKERLPPYMLCIRDPADHTNDLGRKAFAIKHIQATFRSLFNALMGAVKDNERPSLLAPLVGAKFELDRQRRDKLRTAAREMDQVLGEKLAAKAEHLRKVADSEDAAQTNSGGEKTVSVAEQMRKDEEKRQFIRELRDRNWHDLTVQRNQELRPEAERFADISGIDVADIDMDWFALGRKPKKGPRDAALRDSEVSETSGDHLLSSLKDQSDIYEELLEDTPASKTNTDEAHMAEVKTSTASTTATNN